MPANRESSALFPANRYLVLVNQLPDVLEPYRRFKQRNPKLIGQRVDQIRRGHRLCHPVFPTPRLHQIIKEQRDDVIRLHERPVPIHNSEPVRVAIRRNPDRRAHFLHLLRARIQQLAVRLRRMAAKQHVAIVVHRPGLHVMVAQNVRGVSPPRPPERIDHHLQPGPFDRLQVHEFRKPLQIIRLHVDLLVLCARLSRRRHFLKRLHIRLNLVRHLRQRRRPIRSRVFDPVVLRRIMRSGKVDRPARLSLPHRVSNRRRRRRSRNNQRRHAVRRRHLRGLRHKHLTQKSRIASHQ